MSSIAIPNKSVKAIFINELKPRGIQPMDGLLHHRRVPAVVVDIKSAFLACPNMLSNSGSSRSFNSCG